MSQIINLGKRNIEVHSFTGKVANVTKNLETKVHGGGGGGYSYQGTGGSAPVSISSTTVIHDQIFLVDSQGNERALQLTDFDIACRESNNVSAMWAIIEGKDSGPYFAIVNHSTGSKFLNEKIVRSIVFKSVTPILIESKAIGCLLVAGIFIVLGLIYWPLLFLFIAYAIYFEIMVVRKGIKNFKAQVDYPKTSG